MSMKTYVIVDNGLLLTPEIAAWSILAYNRKTEGLSLETLELVNSGRFAKLARADSYGLSAELCKSLGFGEQDFMPTIYEYAKDGLEELKVSCVHNSEFEGSAATLIFPEEKDVVPKEWEFDGSDDLWYIPLQKGPSLFAEQVYASGEEILQELKNQMNGILPEDFDYRSVLVSIEGSVCC